jgi:hypothetical protein
MYIRKIDSAFVIEASLIKNATKTKADVLKSNLVQIYRII